MHIPNKKLDKPFYDGLRWSDVREVGGLIIKAKAVAKILGGRFKLHMFQRRVSEHMLCYIALRQLELKYGHQDVTRKEVVREFVKLARDDILLLAEAGE